MSMMHRPLPKQLRLLAETMQLQRNDEDKRERCRRYYNGHQATEAIRKWRDLHEMTDLTTNLVKEAINSVLGAEEKAQVDWVIRADDEESTDMAEALNIRLNEVMRLVDANHHCSEAYKSQCIGGLGVLYFGRQTDPLRGKYDCKTFPTKNFLYDQTSIRHDSSDCKWMARREYLDREDVKTLFPKHEKLIDDTVSAIGDNDWSFLESSSLNHGQMETGGFVSSNMESLYLDTDDSKIAVFDVYYRTYDERAVISWPDGRVALYDPSNLVHVQANFSKQATVERKRTRVMKRAWFIGPQMVEDGDSPHPHNEFPFIMFRGYHDDDENLLYGLVTEMISPQDAYNEANVQMHHLLNSKLILAEDDAFEDNHSDDEVRIQANSASGYLKHKRGSKIEIITQHDKIRKLAEIKYDAKEEIRMASGISYSFAGQDVEQKSGIAIQSLAEMSANTLAEFNGNYQMARTMFGRVVLSHILDEMGDDQHSVPVKAEAGKQKRTIALNSMDEDGNPSNMLYMARLQVALADVQTSNGHRQQVQNNMMSMYQVSTPEVQDEILPMIVENSDIPRRMEIVENMYKRRGRGMSEEEQAQIDEQQQQQQQRETELVIRERMAKVQLDEANAAKIMAEAELAVRGVTDEQTQMLDAEVDALIQEDDQKKAELDKARQAVAQRAKLRLAA